MSAVIPAADRLSAARDLGLGSSPRRRLQAGATLLETVVFVADKLAWDQPGGRDVEAAALACLRYMLEGPGRLKVVHPWLRQAYQELVGPLEGRPEA